MTHRQLDTFPTNYADAAGTIKFRPFGVMPATVRHLELTVQGQTATFPALRHVSDELSLALTIALPEGDAWLDPNTLTRWGTDVERIAADVAASIGELQLDIRQISTGTYLIHDDAYAGLAWLMPQLTSGLEVAGNTLIWSAGNGMTLITGTESPDGFQIAAAILTERIQADVEIETIVPHRIEDGYWVPAIWPEHATDALHLLERLSAAQWYGRQRDPLYEYYLGQGVDANVPEYQLTQSPDGDTVAACTWVEGIPNLLPHTDIILLVHEDGTAEPVTPESLNTRALGNVTDAGVSPARWYLPA